jgi:ribosome-associated protein
MKLITQIYPELSFEAHRSSGPGGQNVNKTNSAVTLRWNFETSVYLTLEQKELIRDKLKSYRNVEGELVLKSQEFRDQPQNKSAGIRKLEELLTKAFFKPRKRFKTKPTRSSVEKRLTEKKRLSDRKTNRSRKDWS